MQDVHHENFQGAPADGSAWVSGGNQAQRVLRGGSWHNNNLKDLRSASRLEFPGNRFVTLGLRIARTL